MTVATGPMLAVKPGRDARLRLFCFHHAGGGALSFARWQARVDPAELAIVPVRLPGRETRLREAPVVEGDALLSALEMDLGPHLDAPFAFYGHSLGALVAHAFATRLAELGCLTPELLVTAACSAPHLTVPELEREDLGDEELVAVLSRADGLSAFLRERPDWLALTVATLRADLRLARSLRASARPVRGVPVLALAGSRDPLAPVDAVRAWDRWSDADFRLETVDGGHFFLRAPETALLVQRALAAPAQAVVAAR